MNLSDSQIVWAMDILDITSKDLVDIKESDFEEAQNKLSKLKERAKRNFKLAARQYHPDSGSGDDELFKILNEVYNNISKMKLREKEVLTKKYRAQINIKVRVSS